MYLAERHKDIEESHSSPEHQGNPDKSDSTEFIQLLLEPGESAEFQNSFILGYN